MPNIEGFDEKETNWVLGVMKRLKGGEVKHGKCPSEKAWNKLQDNLTECGVQKKNILYMSKVVKSDDKSV